MFEKSLKIYTPYSMNRLFSEFFREFSGVILDVCETIWASFWRCFGWILKEQRKNNYSKNKQTTTTTLFFTSQT